MQKQPHVSFRVGKWKSAPHTALRSVRLLGWVFTLCPSNADKFYGHSKMCQFGPVWNNGRYIWLPHSMSIFLLVEMLWGCFVEVAVFSHESDHSTQQRSPLSCAFTKPCRNKRAKLLKGERRSLCDHLLCPFFQRSSLRDKKPSACRQRSAALFLPPSQPRKAKISQSRLLLIRLPQTSL